jgi:hypothetical protein
MKKFLVTYHGGSMPSDPEAVKQVKAAFGAWLGQAGSAVLDPGAPVRVVAQVANGEPRTQVEVGGYSIVQADSLDAAKAVLRSHPFVARGGTLQVCEIINP